MPLSSTIMAAVFASGLGPGDTSEKVLDYAAEEIVPFVTQCTPLHRHLEGVRRERASWPAYSEAWREWAREDGAGAGIGYTSMEYRWSVLQDEALLDDAGGGKIHDRLLRHQRRSGQRISSIILTDARGGTVAQTRLDTDWFQGDEAIFLAPVEQEQWCVIDGDDGAAHVCVPLHDEAGELLGVAVVTVDAGSL